MAYSQKMKTKYRIVVYQNFNGVTFYKPQVKKNLFDSWHFYGSISKNYYEAYENKERAFEKIEEWKLCEKKRKFKNKIVQIIDNL